MYNFLNYSSLLQKMFSSIYSWTEEPVTTKQKFSSSNNDVRFQKPYKFYDLFTTQKKIISTPVNNTIMIDISILT